jgi:hypothetical protein
VLLVCEEMGLVGSSFFALDALRLPSNASEQWTGTHAELCRKKERVEATVKELVEEHATQDNRDEDSANRRIPTGRAITKPDSKRTSEARNGTFDLSRTYPLLGEIALGHLGDQAEDSQETVTPSKEVPVAMVPRQLAQAAERPASNSMTEDPRPRSLLCNSGQLLDA